MGSSTTYISNLIEINMRDVIAESTIDRCSVVFILSEEMGSNTYTKTFSLLLSLARRLA